ncbi:hypothetical protein [Novosphingobium sp. TH158]|uniref:hypothetical protein n=1 Tax=Novosphingobium sp. TH158 TaxID=2067455 RepID=UPI000C7CBF9A|nr:hypothetical protein [Novosphingobium sp. TH158]PLK26866.1 hypothetical protein C0V78_08160 [Novosphingobium sp. TH158]
MTGQQIAALLGFSALLAAGQALFKASALKLGQTGGTVGGLFSLVAMPGFWLALALYGAGTLLWIYILQTVPLSRAYPFAALGFVIVPIIAALLFAERLNLTYALGAALIVAGVIVTARA